ncbi:MAG: tRNA (adenosine(37)-N6)-threonylcarbamoyltransferase complex ATPase subunit type 1 TsaE [Bacteroidetes bacterium]|nr:tRNA (adenosine(37)-N6)-threonylcarbamoyltransferase complex ATPase subunit type 1 TsaE [Bacteroidota bacterium]
MSTLLALRRPEDAAKVAAALLEHRPQSRVFTFTGPLGAGKTTLIKALCAQLGVGTGMSSPTFSIVNEYRTASGEAVYHFDLYRLKKAEELDGIGFTEYLDSGCYCFVEWPDLAEGLYPPGTVHVELRIGPDGTRMIELDNAHTPHDLHA